MLYTNVIRPQQMNLLGSTRPMEEKVTPQLALKSARFGYTVAECTQSDMESGCVARSDKRNT
jgi:hypothetical protein